MQALYKLRKLADDNGYTVRKNWSRDPDAFDYGLYAVTDVRYGGTTHTNLVNSPYALTLEEVEEELNRLID